MASFNGAFPGKRPASAGLLPEPTRARAPDEPALRPQLGPHLGAPSSSEPFPDFPTESSPASEPPPAYGQLPSPRREEDDSIPPPPPSARPVDAFAEFEGSIAGESTRIDESDLLSEQSTAILDEGPRLPYLFVEAGKDAGKEYALQEGETSIGRGIDNDVILADVSVSRRHVRVLREGAIITLRDLGSGNGTQLNGRRAHVETMQEGDRIEIGETVLVLRVPGAELPAVESNGNATHETLSPTSNPSMPAPLYPTPNALPSLPPAGASTDSLMAPPRDGRTQSIVLPRRMLFVAAGVVAIVGSVIGAGVVTFMGRDPDPVVTGLPLAVPATVPIATPPIPSVAAPPVPGPAVIVPPPTGGVPTPPVAPTAVITEPVPAPPPDVAVAPVVPPAVPEAAPEAVAPSVASGAVREPERERRASSPRREPEPTAAAGSGGGRGREAALAAYRSGDFAGAARLAREAARGASSRDRTALEHLADQIDSFAEIFPRIRGAGTNYASVGTAGGVAIRLDRSIASGHHTRTFQAGYLGWLLDQAESSFSSNPGGACGQARTAGSIESSARARALISRCDARATELLAEGGRVERSDPRRARELYGLVLRISPESREATEARRHIDALGRTRSVDEDE